MHKTLIEEQGFKLLEQIDNTIHTEIWKANQRELDRIVCLQVLKPEASQNALELEHFLLIARIFAKVKSETVAAVFDIVSNNGIHYAVMEYVDGPSVGSLVANGHKISETHILQIASSLAVCLEQLWQKDRIIHRNLKGETVQIDPRGVAKLTDFSLAVTASQDLTALDGGHIVGTPSFIAPEYAQGSKNLTTQADMYSFGALLYQLATGHAPFASLSPVDALSAQIRSQIPPPHCLNRDISIAFSWFIHRLMMKNPNNRYPDWHAVINDIHLLLEGEPPSGIETEERFLSTIDAKPLLDAMNGVLPEEEADVEADADSKSGPSVKLKSNNQKVTQIELEHKRDIQSSNLRLASLMTLLMLVCFAGIFWYRGIWEPEEKRIAEALSKKEQEVVVPPPKVIFKQPTKAVEPVADPTKEPDPVSNGAEDPKPERPPEKPVVRPPLPVVPPPAPLPAVKTNDVPKPVELGPMPEELKKELARAAKSGDLEAMRTAFAAEKSLFIGKELLKPILERAPTCNRLLERTMDSKKDQPISFTWRGKSRIVVPREVTETSVTLEANGRRQEIMFSDLTPDEVVSLVNKPQTEAESLSYCLLLMKSTQKSEVPLSASKCLPLQEVILEAMKE
jgi:serine/threonine protein kinase